MRNKTRLTKFKKHFLRTVSASLLAVSLVGASLTVNAADVYPSELTGLPISTSLQNQRPVAVMVDNEKIALQHYGTSEADIIYEMMNSTANDRITRLMCIYKDYASVPRIGSIRSIRPTNIIISGEYNAVAVHDGGPFYINDWLARPWAAHLSAGFARIPNGKAREFTEYVTTGQIASRLAAAKIPATYTDTFTSTRVRTSHFLFNPAETTLSAKYAGAGVISGQNVDLTAAFLHNKSQLKYNATTKTYDYYEYGSLHKDGEDGAPLTFKNVILQESSFSQLDAHGYLIYNVIGSLPGVTSSGYYLTDGEAIPIVWNKNGETAYTRYYDLNGIEISLNPGKTYIGIVPADYWAGITVK